jgi:hypothetical protein
MEFTLQLPVAEAEFILRPRARSALRFTSIEKKQISSRQLIQNFTCYRYKYLLAFGGPKLLQATERRNTRRNKTSFSLVSHEDISFAAGNTINTVPDPSSEPAPNTLSTKTETAENERCSWYRTLRVDGLMD